jgi:hypothetical protein
MAIKIRPADLETDREAVVRLLARHLNPAYDTRRFDWLYRGNPAGNGRLWLAVDGATGEIVGTAGATPRRMSVEGRPVLGWVLADFCVVEGQRTLGPALQLQRSCLADLTADGMVFCYDFPSESMEGVYRRLAIPLARARLVRFARPLRMGTRLRARWGDSRLVRGVAAAADLVLNRAVRPSRDVGSVSFRVESEPCGEEFSNLYRRVARGYGACAERTAEHLNWRYHRNPIQPHEILSARADGVLEAYAVLTHEGDSAVIADLFGAPEPAVMHAIVRMAVARSAERGFSTVSVPFLDSHPWAAWLHGLGFRPREAAALVLYAAPDSALGAQVINELPWFLTYGDRDA